MERELWPALYQLVRKVGRQVRQRGVTYQPWVIAAMVLWAALHDRPRHWACNARNWSATTHRPWRLPSESVLSRRADSIGMGIFWRRLEDALRGESGHGLLSIVDGKPLFVGGCSKDPDARKGYGAGQQGKGYKIHLIWSNHCVPEAWDVTSLNRSEPVVAGELLPQVDEGDISWRTATTTPIPCMTPQPVAVINSSQTIAAPMREKGIAARASLVCGALRCVERPSARRCSPIAMRSNGPSGKSPASPAD